MAKNANFNRKKQRALKIMAEKGMWRSNYAPPLHGRSRISHYNLCFLIHVRASAAGKGREKWNP